MEIKWNCCCSLLFCLCIYNSFLLSFPINFLLSFSFLIQLQPILTNPYSNMNMLTSPFDQALNHDISNTTNKQEFWPKNRSTTNNIHATNAIYQNKFHLSSRSLRLNLNCQKLTNGKRIHKRAQTNKSLNFHIAPVLRWNLIINLCLWFLLLANSILK